jgi:DNA-binding NarL/FixJ family response regulator
MRLHCRQKRVLEFAAIGVPDHQIALLVNKSERTVKRDWDGLRDLFETRSRTKIVAQAIRLGLIP